MKNIIITGGLGFFGTNFNSQFNKKLNIYLIGRKNNPKIRNSYFIDLKNTTELKNLFIKKISIQLFMLLRSQMLIIVKKIKKSVLKLTQI